MVTREGWERDRREDWRGMGGGDSRVMGVAGRREVDERIMGGG